MSEIKIIAYASSSEYRKNQLVSAAQYKSALPKNVVEFDVPLVRLFDHIEALSKIGDQS